ncbi:MAG: hypothetical protein FJX62_08195 [Alphaproteobacteria bacterium]|nr:hypothetical protein [Alphaproteobacteria bacterium]
MSGPFDDERIAAGMRAQMELRRTRFADGALMVGWKAGFGAPAARQSLRIRMPLVGFLVDSALIDTGATVSLEGWRKPIAEAEIAAYIGRDLPANADRETVRRAIVAIGPAIELIDVDGPMDDVPAILAGDIFQRHVILGRRDIMRSGARLDGLKARVFQSGKEIVAPADLETNTGRVHETVAHVADIAAALGEGLRAGQVIICGSITPPMFLQPGETGVSYTLEPVGSISVRFSGGA